jgi:hypothetical protein
MGMFDSLINSWKPLGEENLNREFQTKDLDCCMENYWLSPAGELFVQDMKGTAEWVEDSNYFLGYRTQFTGKHGKVSPVFFTGGIRIYHYDFPSPEGRGHKCTQFSLLFRKGRLIYLEEARPSR